MPNGTTRVKKIRFNPKSLLNIDQTTHGMSKMRIYRTWKNMRARCNNAKYPDYYLYGGRGITYDPKWQTFEGFYEDMKEGYADNLTIDRILFSGNYEKSNCRWATYVVQANNTRRNRFFTYRGKVKTLTQWARELGISYIMLKKRIIRGWSFEKAIITPRVY